MDRNGITVIRLGIFGHAFELSPPHICTHPTSGGWSLSLRASGTEEQLPPLVLMESTLFVQLNHRDPQDKDASFSLHQDHPSHALLSSPGQSPDYHIGLSSSCRNCAFSVDSTKSSSL